MKIFRRCAAVLIASLTLLMASLPAHASEGFTFNWDGGRDDDSDHPHCKSIFMMNLDTGTTVYTLNPDEQLPMASMTKIMTYIVAYETIPDIEHALIPVPQSVEDDLDGTGSSLAGVMVGEEINGLDMLNLLMIPSGNDAALCLMEYVDNLYASGRITVENGVDPEDPAGGSQPADPTPVPEEIEEFDEPGRLDYTGESFFVEQMNKKAQELGCKNTHFTNPHGLHHPNHYSTARDMAKMTEYALTLPHFAEITGQMVYTKPATNINPSEEDHINTNKLLRNFPDEYGNNYFYTYATGIKTGSHDQAGHCLAASATAYGYTYIAVLMGDMEGYEQGIHNEMLDARSLFRWALTELEKKTITTQGDILSSVKLEYAFQKDELQLAAGENVSVMLPKNVDMTSILVTVDKPESVQAPVRKGEVIGTAALSYAGEVIATVPVMASESVARSDLIAGWEQGKSLLTSPWFLAVMGVIGALIVVYLILVVFYRRKQRQLRRVRKFRDL